MSLVEKLIGTGNIRWVFVCGLGEPTVKNNYPHLISILSLCKKHDIKCSMFTNLVNFTDEIKEYIEQGILYILFKLDSFDRSKVQKLFSLKNVNEYLLNIDKAKELVSYDHAFTNIAASSVPTNINIDEIKNIIAYCVENNIFPMIGGLENAGMDDDVFESLRVPDNELIKIKDYIAQLTGVEYLVPICPSVIGGIHISNENQLVVDYYTGLSCHWFWLEPPKTEVIASLDESTEYSQIINAIEKYRSERLFYITQNISAINDPPFGGCGGDVSYMLRKYLSTKQNNA